MKHAVAIVTYAPEGRFDVSNRVERCLRSLLQSEYHANAIVVIVDDGSCTEHRRRLNSYRSDGVQIVLRETNGGICRAKNTAIRALMECDVDIGFIAEDDAEFCGDWWKPYLEAHQKTGISHFSWAWDDDPSGQMRKAARTVKSHTIVETSRVNGVLLTFTPAVIETVGGFRIMPAPWGHTHTNWTHRIIEAGLAPFYCDVVDSNRYVMLSDGRRASAFSRSQKQQFERQNSPYCFDAESLYCEVSE